MKTIRRTLVPFFGLCFVLGLAFGKGQQATTVQVQPVAGKVSVLFGEGGNIGISAGPDGLLIVDDQFERLASQIDKELAKLAGDPAKARPRFLVNTHHHDDHTNGNARLGQSAVIVAHENVRARLEEAKAKAQALPVLTYAESVSLHFNGEEIRLLHVPEAHTDGDTVVWFTGSNVVHLGDLYFQLGYPFVDTANGGSVLGLIEGLRGLLAQLPSDARFIPGHGVVTDRAGVEEYLKMLATITARVRTHLAAGHDVDAMMAAGVTQDFDERWGHFDFVPPKSFVERVIASLH